MLESSISHLEKDHGENNGLGLGIGLAMFDMPGEVIPTYNYHRTEDSLYPICVWGTELEWFHRNKWRERRCNVKVLTQAFCRVKKEPSRHHERLKKVSEPRHPTQV